MVQGLRSHAPSAGPIPGMGTMILHAAQHGLKNEKEKTNAPQLYQEHTLSGLSWFCDKTGAVGLNLFLYKAYLFVDKQYWRWDERRQYMDLGYPILIIEKFPRIGPNIHAVFYSKRYNYFFQECNEPESDKLSNCVTKGWKAIVGLVFRKGATNAIYQFISFIIYLRHVDFVADMSLFGSILRR